MSTFSSLSKYLYQVFWTGFDWLYPPVCAGCGARGYRWCSGCEAKTEKVSQPVCFLCGRGNQEKSLCVECQHKKPAFDGLRSWAIYQEPIRQAIHQMKYHRDITLGETFSHNLEKLLHQVRWQFEMIVPVPLSRQRVRQRGYNQSTFLAFPLALSLNVPMQPSALERVRETSAQVGLTATQRRKNVENAFRADRELTVGRVVLLVDDVMTTGATLEACASALKNAGASTVYGLTLARSNWPDQAG